MTEVVSIADSPWLRMARCITALWTVALVLALTPYTGDPAAPVKYFLTGWALVFIAALLLLEGLSGRKTCPLPAPLTVWLTAFLGVYLIAALFSDFPFFALNRMATWAMLSGAALLTAQQYRHPEHAWRLIEAAVGAVALSSIYGFCQRAGWDPFPWAQTNIEEYRGLPSTYANPNFAGHTLVLAIPLAVSALYHRTLNAVNKNNVRVSWVRRWAPAAVLAISLALLLAHLHATGMRGGRLGLAAAVAMLGCFRLARWRGIAPLRAGILCCAGLGTMAAIGFAVLLIGTSQTYRDKPLPIDGSLVLRLNGYHGATKMILDRPVLGFGPGNYELCNIPYWTAYEKHWFASEHKKNSHVHCDALEAAVDAGLPGAGLYLGLLLLGILGALTLTGADDPSRRRLGYALAACLTSFAVDGQFGFNLRVPVSGVLFFVLLGLTASMMPPRERQRGRMLLTQSLLVALLLVTAVAHSAAFFGEFMLQRGKGGLYWANHYRQRGESPQEQRALHDADVYVERGRRTMPWDARFPELQGQFALRLGNLDQAIACFSRALVLHPHHPDIAISLAQAHLNLAVRLIADGENAGRAALPGVEEHLSAGQTAAEKALGLCEVYPDAEEALGRIALLRATLAERGGGATEAFWGAAETHFGKALLLGARNRVELNTMLASAAVRNHHIDAAERALSRAAYADPGKETTWRDFYRLAREHGRSEAFFEALSANLGRLKRQTPPPTQAVGTVSLYLSDIYASEKKQPDYARQILLEALALDPGQLAVWGAYATLLPRESRLSALQSTFAAQFPGEDKSLPDLLILLRDLKTDTPDSLLAAAKSALVAAQTRREEHSAEQVAREYRWLANLLLDQVERVAMDPADKGAVWTSLGMVYAAGARWEEADRLLARAQPLLPEGEQPALLIQRSEALANLQHPEEALALAREAIRMAPASSHARWNMARRLTEAGRLKEANFEYAALVSEISEASAAGQKIAAERRALLEKLNETAGEGTPQ